MVSSLMMTEKGDRGQERRPYRVFFYGSMLNPEDLRDLGINVDACEPAYIEGYRVVFDKASVWRCAAANLESCKGCRTTGIVCRVDYNTLVGIDGREKGYTRVIVEYTTFTGFKGKAYTYISSRRLDSWEVDKCFSECDEHGYEDCRLGKYVKTIAKGVRYWEGKAPGFKEEYLKSVRSGGLHERIERLFASAVEEPV